MSPQHFTLCHFKEVKSSSFHVCFFQGAGNQDQGSAKPIEADADGDRQAEGAGGEEEEEGAGAEEERGGEGGGKEKTGG